MHHEPIFLGVWVPPDDQVSYIGESSYRIIDIVPDVPKGEDLHASFPIDARTVCFSFFCMNFSFCLIFTATNIVCLFGSLQ